MQSRMHHKPYSYTHLASKIMTDQSHVPNMNSDQPLPLPTAVPIENATFGIMRHQDCARQHKLRSRV